MNPIGWLEANMVKAIRGMGYPRLDVTTRAVAETWIARNRQHHEEAGYKKLEWNKRGVPIDLDKEWPSFMDHFYRLRRGKENIYVSEPYQLNGDDIKRLSRLIDEGWSVDISNYRGLHAPGTCVVVTIERAA